MGVCETNNNPTHLVKVDEQIKNLSKDYLFENSNQESIKKNYKLLKKEIGHGSFGKVFIGIDSDGKKYAIKCIKKKRISKGQLLANEVRIGLKMHHPNIVGIKEVYEDMKKISLVMDYCDGGDLLNFITKSPHEKLDDMYTIDIITQILEALNYLHNEVKICHRDLKPENCLICFNGNNEAPLVKLIDFGIATYIYNGEKMKEKIDTVNYMAPEIFSKPSYNEKIDLWSAGIILYNMTTGCEPFEFKKKEFKKIHSLNNKDINFDLIKNESIRELCKEMLERNPNKRIDAKTALKKAINIKRNIYNKFLN